jgi:ribonuclease P protein subunit RPR2
LRRGRKQKWMIKIARERIEILFNEAEKELSHHPERSNRYVQMARNLAQKYNLKIQGSWRGRICKNCHSFLRPGLNSQVRLSDTSLRVKCLKCGYIRRIPYIKEKKERRRSKIESYTFKEGINE